jgi:REP element-mobilizing transposase RayT
MPDHLHLFVAPDDPEIPLENWVRYWKSCFSKQHGNREHRWQTDHWDTRLRAEESYDNKWDYVVQNPVRKGLVSEAEQWPFQGEIFELRW